MTNQKTAPIVLFVYNRPDHTRRTIEALQKNHLASESDIFIFSDGPKKDSDSNKVQEVREFIQSIEGFRTVTIKESDINLGLSKSILKGMNTIFNSYERAIILEDDLVSNASFLEFMNKALELYEDQKSVYSITGYSYTSGANKKVNSKTYFLNLTNSWSWATWKDRWEQFYPFETDWSILKNNKKIRKRFNFEGSYNFYKIILKQSRGEVDSWAIRWYLYVFMNNGLTLYPNTSLINNIGLDGSGTHCGISRNYGQLTNEDGFAINFFPENVSEDPIIRKEVVKQIKRKNVRKIFSLFSKDGFKYILKKF
ncbi:glycosyltransferase [Bacillus sp. V3]|nr:glycosyltransferase [Bacillus sp. V3]